MERPQQTQAQHALAPRRQPGDQVAQYGQQQQGDHPARTQQMAGQQQMSGTAPQQQGTIFNDWAMI